MGGGSVGGHIGHETSVQGVGDGQVVGDIVGGHVTSGQGVGNGQVVGDIVGGHVGHDTSVGGGQVVVVTVGQSVGGGRVGHVITGGMVDAVEMDNYYPIHKKMLSRAFTPCVELYHTEAKRIR